jgi:aminoglycoside 6'-N-acetyltransferase I
MSPEIRLVISSDAPILDRVAEGVFDGAVVPELLAEFLADRRHHLIVAIADGVVIGMITAVDYVHPDKAAQLWINEVGVSAAHRRRGVARELLKAMLRLGTDLGCTEAWLGTEHDNVAARALYETAGSVGEPFLLYSFDLSEPPWGDLPPSYPPG